MHPERAKEKAEKEEAEARAKEAKRIDHEDRVAKAELKMKFPAGFPEAEKAAFDGIRPEVAIKYAEAVKGVRRIEGGSRHNDGTLEMGPGEWNTLQTCYCHEAGHAAFLKHEQDAAAGDKFYDFDWENGLKTVLTPAGQRIFDALKADAEKFFDDNGGQRKRKVQKVGRNYEIVDGERNWGAFSIDTIASAVFGEGRDYDGLSIAEKGLIGCITDIFESVTDSEFRVGPRHGEAFYRDAMWGAYRRLNEPFADLSALLALSVDSHAKNALAIFPTASAFVGEVYGIKKD